MNPYGLQERRNTLAWIKTINGGRAWQGSAADDYEVPRDSDDRIAPHAVISFGAPVRSARDRNLAGGEKEQPHILFLDVACVSGDPDESQDLASAIFDILLDWRPSDTADPFEAKGGYGTRRAATSATPTRFVEGLFFEAVVNQGLPA